MTMYPHIVVGTYEEFLLGYEIEKPADAFKLNLTMASHAHQGSIRCVAAHGHYLATSGADEYVNIFSMINRKEVAVLTPHAGTVTCLAFAPDGTHLISGSQDGSIVIFRCSDWTLVKIWKDAHKKANGVTSLSVHPSGKLLLSIGADNTLRAWNLVKGRLAYAVNLSKHTSVGNTLNLVSWSGDGKFYGLGIGDTVMIYNVDTAAVVRTIKTSSRLSCFDMLLPGVVAVGRDDGMIEFYKMVSGEKILEHQGHERRVKCINFFNHDKEQYLVSADSQGIIRLWRWKRTRQLQKLTQEAEVTADCRIICLTLLDPNKFVKTETTEETSNVVEQTIEANKSVECVVVDDESETPSKKTKNTKQKVKKANGHLADLSKSEGPVSAGKNGVSLKKKLKVENSTNKEGDDSEKNFSGDLDDIVSDNQNGISLKKKKLKIGDSKKKEDDSEIDLSTPEKKSKRKSLQFEVSPAGPSPSKKLNRRKSGSTTQWNVT